MGYELDHGTCTIYDTTVGAVVQDELKGSRLNRGETRLVRELFLCRSSAFSLSLRHWKLYLDPELICLQVGEAK